MFKHLFISYGRRESLNFVARLHQKLKLAGYEIWFDKIDIPDAERYDKRISQGIEAAHNFIYVMAPRALMSPYCLVELEYARVLGKRVIPINQMMINKAPRRWEQDTGELSEDERRVLHDFYAAHGLADPNLETTQQLLEHSIKVVGGTDWLDGKERLTDEDCQGIAAWAQRYENHWHKHEDTDYLQNLEIPVFGHNIDSLDSIVERIQTVLERHKPYVEKHTEVLAQALKWQRNQHAVRYLPVGKERYAAQDWLLREFKEGEQAPCEANALICDFICEARKNGENLLTDAFICYDSADKTMRDAVVRALSRHAVTTWRHDSDIQSGEASEQAILDGIAGADNLLYFISPRSVQSVYCQKELDYALSLNKRIIPLLIEETPEIPEILRDVQHIDCRGGGIETLLRALDNERGYYAQHKTLLKQALKWQCSSRKISFLLRGYNLENAKIWLRLNDKRGQHPPTALQRELIQSSEAAKGRLGTEVFISYSRKDGDFARLLNLKLQEAGKTTWFDQESIASGVDFETELYKGIDGADNFLFILSPDAVESEYCEAEVLYAQAQGKRILTVLARKTEARTLPEALRTIHWIDFREQQDFDKQLGELIQALDLDRVHANQHTKLQQRALEWKDNEKSEDFLLNKSACVKAEQWREQADGAKKNPVPTKLQRDYIDTSRRAIKSAEAAEEQKQRRTFAVVMGGMIFAVALALFSLIQMNSAQKNLRHAKQSLYHSKAQSFKQQDPSLALRLAERALQLNPTDATVRHTLEQIVSDNPAFYLYGPRMMFDDDGTLSALTLSADEKYIMGAFRTNDEKTRIRLWDVENAHLKISFDDDIKMWSGEGAKLLAHYGQDREEGGADKIIDKFLSRADKQSKIRDKGLHMFRWRSGSDPAALNEAETKEATAALRKDFVRELAFNPKDSGWSLALGGSPDKLEGGRLRVWYGDQQGLQLYLLEASQDKPVRHALFSADGRYVLSVDNGNDAVLWDLARKSNRSFKLNETVLQIAAVPEPGIQYEGLEGTVRFVVLDNDGRLLLLTESGSFLDLPGKAEVHRAVEQNPASADGLYDTFSFVGEIKCPTDVATYKDKVNQSGFYDYGYWEGGTWCGQSGEPGYWVWVEKDAAWYIWDSKTVSSERFSLRFDAAGKALLLFSESSARLYYWENLKHPEQPRLLERGGTTCGENECVVRGAGFEKNGAPFAVFNDGLLVHWENASEKNEVYPLEKATAVNLAAIPAEAGRGFVLSAGGEVVRVSPDGGAQYYPSPKLHGFTYTDKLRPEKLLIFRDGKRFAAAARGTIRLWYFQDAFEEPLRPWKLLRDPRTATLHPVDEVIAEVLDFEDLLKRLQDQELLQNVGDIISFYDEKLNQTNRKLEQNREKRQRLKKGPDEDNTLKLLLEEERYLQQVKAKYLHEKSVLQARTGDFPDKQALLDSLQKTTGGADSPAQKSEAADKKPAALYPPNTWLSKGLFFLTLLGIALPLLPRRRQFRARRRFAAYIAYSVVVFIVVCAWWRAFLSYFPAGRHPLELEILACFLALSLLTPGAFLQIRATLQAGAVRRVLLVCSTLFPLGAVAYYQYASAKLPTASFEDTSVLWDLMLILFVLLFFSWLSYLALRPPHPWKRLNLIRKFFKGSTLLLVFPVFLGSSLAVLEGDAAMRYIYAQPVWLSFLLLLAAIPVLLRPIHWQFRLYRKRRRYLVMPLILIVYASFFAALFTPAWKNGTDALVDFSVFLPGDLSAASSLLTALFALPFSAYYGLRAFRRKAYVYSGIYWMAVVFFGGALFFYLPLYFSLLPVLLLLWGTPLWLFHSWLGRPRRRGAWLKKLLPKRISSAPS